MSAPSNEDLAMDLDRLRTEQDELIRRLTAIRRAVAHHEETARTEREATRSALDEVHAELRAARAELESAHGELGAAHGEMRRVREDLERMRAEAASLEELRASVLGELDSLSRTLARLDSA